MKKQLMKATLFVLTSAMTLEAHSVSTDFNELTLLEQLPVEQRSVVHKSVVNFLIQNPEMAVSAKVIAVDKNGVIYVFDENEVKLCAVGNPSCVVEP